MGNHLTFDTELSAELIAKISSISTKVDLIHKAVEGNGQPGLRQRVETLERTHSGDDRVKSDKQTRKVLYVSVVATLGTWVGIIYHIMH